MAILDCRLYLWKKKVGIDLIPHGLCLNQLIHGREIARLLNSMKKSKKEKITIKVDNNIAEEFAKAINEQVKQDKLEAWKYELLNKNKKL